MKNLSECVKIVSYFERRSESSLEFYNGMEISMESCVKIIYKDKDAVIIEKPVGMPSQSDPSGDIDAMTCTAESLKRSGESDSLWLVHRLDRTVGGLLVFARNKRSAAELSTVVCDGSMVKKYIAICHGSVREGEYRDYLYKDSVASKAYVVKTQRRGAKLAVLYADKLCERDECSLVSVRLETGRFHQIRAQLSSEGTPLVGDKKYGSRDAEAKTPALFAYRLEFSLFGKKISASALPDVKKHPWCLFDEQIYESIENGD